MRGNKIHRCVWFNEDSRNRDFGLEQKISSLLFIIPFFYSTATLLRLLWLLSEMNQRRLKSRSPPTRDHTLLRYADGVRARARTRIRCIRESFFSLRDKIPQNIRRRFGRLIMSRFECAICIIVLGARIRCAWASGSKFGSPGRVVWHRWKLRMTRRRKSWRPERSRNYPYRWTSIWAARRRPTCTRRRWKLRPASSAAFRRSCWIIAR